MAEKEICIAQDFSRSRPENLGISRKIIMFAGVGVAAAAVLAGASMVSAGDGAFALTAGQLDRVTAGGVSIVTDGFSASWALGQPGLSDSMTTASVDPEAGAADATALAAGAGGAQAVVDTSGIAETGGLFVQTDGTADGFSYDDAPVYVTSTSTLSPGGTDAAGGSLSIASAPESYSQGSALIQVTDGGTSLTALSGGTGVDAAWLGSATEAAAALSRPGGNIYITSFSVSDGTVIAVTEALGTTTATVSGIGFNTLSSAETASDIAGSAQTTNAITSGGSGLILRSTGTAIQSGTAFADPATSSAVNLNGMPAGATVTGISRSSLRGGISRSLTVRMVNQ